ncbi:hypothetical protein AZE42_14083, partial [Rhizopogon vesiculosus]
MSEHPLNNTASLRIWQQNLNTSHSAQASLLNNPNIADWDLITIQEPYLNSYRNTTANHHWSVYYPTQHLSHNHQRSRAVTLVKTSLNTNNCRQLPFPSSDVVVVQLSGPYGRCTIFNI